MSNKFDVLGTMRAIRDDESLSTAQAAILLCAVLRTDNSTMKVKYSLEGLAVDAKCNEKTVRRAMQDPEVLKYFSKVERNSRRVDLWFNQVDDIAGHCVQVAGLSVPVAGHSVRPSTSTSTSSSTKTTEAADATSSNFKTHELGKGRYMYTTTTSPNLQTTHEPFYVLDLETMTTSAGLPDTESAIEDPWTYKGRRYLTRQEVADARKLDEQVALMGGDW